MTARVIVGDSLDVLKTLEPNSIDAICTDPPAGIAFMSRSWDSDLGGRDAWVAWLAAILSEAHRVAKPGAYAVVWALPRTSGWTHRAIEDAGWRVTDCITHLFGSGFPKSTSIGKMLDKVNGETDRALRFTAWMRTTGLTAKRIDEITGTFMGGHYTTHPTQPAVATRECFEKLRPFLGPDVPEWVETLIDRIEAEREIVGCSENGIAGGTGQHAGQDGSWGFRREYDITAPATDLARQWDGFGTALKPAAEFWYLAQKPRESTYAANVAKWGVGALNIAATRVGTDDTQRKNTGGEYNPPSGYRTVRPVGGVTGSSAGRWPSNVVLSHNAPDADGNGGCVRVGVIRVRSQSKGTAGGNVEHAAFGGGMKNRGNEFGHADPDGFEQIDAWDCERDAEGRFTCAVAMLDEQAGESTSRAGWRNNTNQGHEGWSSGTIRSGPLYSGHNDQGGKSRFFPTFPPDPPGLDGARFLYQPKESRRARNAGLDGMPDGVGFRKNTSEWKADARHPDGGYPNTNPGSPQHNHHPTVKSVYLMRWLVRLVTPPGGTVLDCFAGSGSTLIAAVLEGFDCIGIEQDESYAEIATRRIRHAERHGERWLDAAGTKQDDSGRFFAGDAKVKTCAACGRKCANGLTACPRCGGAIERREKTPDLATLPLFAKAGD